MHLTNQGIGLDEPDRKLNTLVKPCWWDYEFQIPKCPYTTIEATLRCRKAYEENKTNKKKKKRDGGKK